MNAIERAKQIIELSAKSPGTLYTSENCEEHDKILSDYLVVSHNHAPEIAKLFLEAVEILKNHRRSWHSAGTGCLSECSKICSFLKKIEGSE